MSLERTRSVALGSWSAVREPELPGHQITTPSNFALHTQTGAKDFAGVQHLVCPWMSALKSKTSFLRRPNHEYIFLCALDLTSMCEMFALRWPRTRYAQLF